jgi:trimeric autotransporter adhesin
VAGDGGNARYGEGGLATLTSLSTPFGVTVDASGNIFLAELGRHRIRMVTTSTGIISTVAGNGTSGYSGDGGLATSAALNYPSSIALDAAGDVYIADTENNRIRMVTKSTGIISTVAGNGTPGYSGDGGLATSAKLARPNDVALDALGNIYIADTWNNCLRMVTKSTGIISTVAGIDKGGYSGDGGLATLARIYAPCGVAVDASGNIYIADTKNNRLRMVTKSTGIISTVAGNGTRGYSGDGGLAKLSSLRDLRAVAVDASGNIYIADPDSSRIRMVTKSTGIISTVAGIDKGGYSGDGGLATSAALKYPNGVAVDASGNVYIADTEYNHVRMITKSTGVISTVAGDMTSGYSGDGGIATSARLYSPRGIAFDASGNIYIADSGSSSIRMVTNGTGIMTTVAGYISLYVVNEDSGDGGLATSAKMYWPSGVALDASGNIYIADLLNHRIRMVMKSTGIISTVAGNGISGYSGDGGLAPSAALNNPRGIALDTSANIYIADIGNHRIRMVTKSTGIISTVAGVGKFGNTGDGGLATSAKLYNPQGVAVDALGNIYIADTWNHRIRMVTKSSGVISTVAGNGTRGYSGDGGLATLAALNIPRGIALDRSGNIYIADTLNHRIRIVTKSTGVISTVAGNGTSGYSGDGGPAALCLLDSPSNIAVDVSGNIYICDTKNNRLRILTLADISAASPTLSPSPSSSSTVAPTVFSPIGTFVTSASPGKRLK